MHPTLYLLAAENIAASNIAGPADVFHIANLVLKNLAGADAEPLRWKVVGVERKEITSASGMKIQPELALDEIKSPGWLIIPGVVTENEGQLKRFLEHNRALISALRSLYDSGINLASNCTGTFLLAETGVLDGKSATTSWWLEHLFQQRYPRIELDIEAVVTEHKRLICSGTAMAHMELALTLVSRLLGGKYAHLTRKYLLMESSQTSQAPYRRLSSNQTDPFIQSANQYVFDNLHHDIRIDDLAQALAVSSRTLIRRFKQVTGDTPLQHIQKLRIERSKYLLETSQLPTDEVIQRVGYQDNSTFGRIFKRYTGLTPGQYRSKFALSPP